MNNHKIVSEDYSDLESLQMKLVTEKTSKIGIILQMSNIKKKYILLSQDISISFLSKLFYQDKSYNSLVGYVYHPKIPRLPYFSIICTQKISQEQFIKSYLKIKERIIHYFTYGKNVYLEEVNIIEIYNDNFNARSIVIYDNSLIYSSYEEQLEDFRNFTEKSKLFSKDDNVEVVIHTLYFFSRQTRLRSNSRAKNFELLGIEDSLKLFNEELSPVQNIVLYTFSKRKIEETKVKRIIEDEFKTKIETISKDQSNIKQDSSLIISYLKSITEDNHKLKEKVESTFIIHEKLKEEISDLVSKKVIESITKDLNQMLQHIDKTMLSLKEEKEKNIFDINKKLKTEEDIFETSEDQTLKKTISEHIEPRFSEFIEKKCIKDTSFKISTKILHKNYYTWMKENYPLEKCISKPEIKKLLQKENIMHEKKNGELIYCGLSLK